MKERLAITGSVTYAIRAKEALNKNGYNARVKRITTATDTLGCGYGVATTCSAENISRLFSAHGIRLIKIIEDGV